MHTERRLGDSKRPHPKTVTVGDRVQIKHKRGPIQGKVYNVDAGGWIYVQWSDADGIILPGYLRPTQVVPITEDKDGTH